MKDTGLHKMIPYWVETILNSYSQLFFSMNRTFAVFILIASLLSIKAGLGGLAAVVVINVLAYVNSLDKAKIKSGVFGYNALLLGMALFTEYCCNTAIYLLFIFATMFLLLVSTFLQGFLEKYKLPYLSIPFLITWSIVKLAAGSFAALEISQDQVFLINQQLLDNSALSLLVHQIDWHISNPMLRTFLLTLGSIVFQHSTLAGLLIALGLLFYSRIFLSLSLLGFLSAYFFYVYFGADIQGLTYFLGGSNFIFMALAVGGYYVVPDKFSYFAVIVLVPVTAFLHISLGKILYVFQLHTFTLSFSIVVICFLFFLYQRNKQSILLLVYHHFETPESQLYHHRVQVLPSRQLSGFQLSLPFYGKWKVSQGYEGGITHLGDWSKALDFIIVDEHDTSYKGNGLEVSDYYCYHKPVLAPADGYVYDILDVIDDNPVGGMDTDKNWGNTIILNHANGLYTQISHILKGSFQVKIGDYVTKGTLLAYCGNSGRSPEPHIHFQVQYSPVIGAPAIEQSFRYFIQHTEKGKQLKISEVPVEGSLIEPLEESTFLQQVFNWLPGKRFVWKNSVDGSTQTWIVATNAWNQRYIQCQQTSATAYFVYDGSMVYFTGFTGSRNSLLYQFYLASYRVVLSTQQMLPITDRIPLSDVESGPLRWVQDTLAPFIQFQYIEYSSSFSTNGDTAFVESYVRMVKGMRVKRRNFQMKIVNGSLAELSFNKKRFVLCDI